MLQNKALGTWNLQLQKSGFPKMFHHACWVFANQVTNYKNKNLTACSYIVNEVLATLLCTYVCIHGYVPSHLGFKYLSPPPLPSNHVKREALLDEILTKLLQATNDPSVYEVTLTITGAGGFGKTAIMISLCHQTLLKESFTDGFLFIELGPQANDPSIKLKDIYNLLTGESCGINVVQQKINQLTSDHFRNLLVIIDDVWHVEDAEPLVKAFRNCKTILATRMNDIMQYIPSKQSVIIGPMSQQEANFLLTSGVIDSRQLSQEDMSLLDELALDVHLGPLLLSLMRGQLSHYVKQRRLSCHQAIHDVQIKLYHKGLTAFDKNNIEKIDKSRKLAVKACIEITLELLSKSLLDKLKSIILYNGFGTPLPAAFLKNLLSISKQEAEDALDILWAYGLIQFTDFTVSANTITQHCVEVHDVIGHYIIECMDSYEAYALFEVLRVNYKEISNGFSLTFEQSYGVHDPLSLSVTDYLKYKLNEIENVMLPFQKTSINMSTLNEPHSFILLLQQFKEALLTSPCTKGLVSLLDKEIISLIFECKQILKYAYKLCRKLNQSFQRNLYEKNFDELIQTVEEYIKNYPLCNVAQKAVTMIEGVIPYCDSNLQLNMKLRCEDFLVKTPGYHCITTFILPSLKLDIKLHNQITTSLLNGSPFIELTYHYIMSDKVAEEREIVATNYLIKLQEVAPNYVGDEVL